MANTTDEPALNNQNSGAHDYEQLMEDYSHFAPPSEGEVLSGHVLKVTDKDVIVDVGLKSEGIVPLSQFPVLDGVPQVHAGDTIEVMVDRDAPHQQGFISLSHEKAVRLRAWDNLEKAQAENLMILGRVLERTKGGLSVDVGVIAFLPGSQIDVRPLHNVSQFIGQDIPVKVVKVNRRRGNVVVSRRAAIEEEVQHRKKDVLDHLGEGALVTGVVKNITDYGAFLDLGGIDGLLHVSDMSYGRITHPSELLHVGDELTVKILKYDQSRERISLGLKQLQPDPWETIEESYPLQSRVVGRVVSVTDYGAFVELQPGVEGLIHISEMTWSRRMKHPSKVLKVGDEVEAVVLEVKPKERRVSLGIKQLEADPWTTVADRYAVGSVVEGRVRKLTDFGAFIEIEEGIDGLAHISDLSWTKRVKHPSEVLKKGQVVQAVILQIDAENRRLSLGIKQLQPDAWETFFRTHQVGDTVRGQVCRAASFGMFVEVAPGVEGLCHNSEVPGTGDRRREASPLPIGAEYDFKIIKMNEAEKKIGLSIKAIGDDEEKGRMREYQRQAAAAGSGLEDHLGARAPEEEQGE